MFSLFFNLIKKLIDVCTEFTVRFEKIRSLNSQYKCKKINNILINFINKINKISLYLI